MSHRFNGFTQIGLSGRMTELRYKELTFAGIGAAMQVHKILRPGFLEAVYQVALERELTLRGMPFEKQVKLPVTYWSANMLQIS